MPLITALEVQKKNKERINIYVDDEFFCGLTLEDTVKNRLAVNMNLTEAELSNLREASGENDLFNKALVYILKSPKTERQVKQYLNGKQCAPETAGHILSRLKILGYINDEDYARRFTEVKSEKMGARAIRQKLCQKGVNSAIIDESLTEIGDQTDLAVQIAEKYMRTREPDLKTYAKLFRYLMGKGFDYDMATQTVNKIKEHK